jgi:3-phytase
MRIHPALVLLVFLMGLPVGAQPVNVAPVVETQPIVRGGSSSQDTALWVNASAPVQSLLLVSDSVVGLVAFRLDGVEQDAVLSGPTFGVDVRDDFVLPGGTAPLIVVGDGALPGLTAYIVDPVSNRLRRVDSGNLRVTGFSPRTVTLYRSAITGALYAFMSNDTGTMQQLELRPGLDGGVEGVPVRSFAVGGAVAGAVADDQRGFLFVAEQGTGIWRYSAEPSADDERISVADTTAPLTAPLGGLSLFSLPNGTGYLLAASAGGNQVVIFNRQPPHAAVGSFRVVQDGGIDAVDDPLTVEASSLSLGPGFPSGLVAVHDSLNDPMQNDKIIPWPDVASAFNPPLQVRQPETDGGTPDGGRDGGTGGGGGGGGIGGGGVTSPVEPESGCNCASASVPGTLVFGLLALALRNRRRQG